VQCTARPLTESEALFLTSALERGEGSASRPGRTLPPGKNRYPFYRKLQLAVILSKMFVLKAYVLYKPE
jgi:hypothetical protein